MTEISLPAGREKMNLWLQPRRLTTGMKATVLLLFFFLLAMPARAEIVKSAHTEAELVSETTVVLPGQPFWTALRLKMDKHWHTYWRNPGDSGLETSIDWDLPEGFKADAIQWPFPVRLDLPPLAVYAYEDEVYLLTKITPPENLPHAEAVEITANARWLACEVNCIPGQGTFSLKLSSGAVDNAGTAETFAAARARLPLAETEWKITARASDDFILIEAVPPEDASYVHSKLEFFPFDGEIIAHAGKQKFSSSSAGAKLLVARSRLNTGQLTLIEGILVSKEGWRGEGSEKAVEIRLEPGVLESIPVFQDTPPGMQQSIGIALLFAFVGGMILNLMPCVFPVLSLKILGFVEHSRQGGGKAWHHGAAFAAGVILSFWILAGSLIFFRAAGEAVGWGYQLQSPVFVAALIVLFYLLALNLLGIYEIGVSLTGAGSRAKASKSLGGSFWGGVLATLIATPCTAPFMGTALGYALTRPPATAFAIFTALGLGMAFPYMLLSLFPGVARRLPRPGPWMDNLKKFLSLFLFATVGWLIWVFSLQTESNALPMLSAGLLLVMAGARVYGKKYQADSSAPGSRRFLVIAAVLAVSGATISLLSAALNERTSMAVTEEDGSGLQWIPYSPEIIPRLREQGRPVFLDFTAAWCLTCHVNERVALNQKEVKKKFQEYNVALVKADWTSRDEAVTRALASFGRTSIPFYVLYPSGKGTDYQTLPEILTPGIVLEALEKIGRK